MKERDWNDVREKRKLRMETFDELFYTSEVQSFNALQKVLLDSSVNAIMTFNLPANQRQT